MAILKGVTINEGHMSLPKGTCAERPSTPDHGEYRFNTDFNLPERYDSCEGQWRPTLDVVRGGLKAFWDATDPQSYSGSGTDWINLAAGDRYGQDVSAFASPDAEFLSTPVHGQDSNGVYNFDTQADATKFCMGGQSNQYGLFKEAGFTIMHAVRENSPVASACFNFYQDSANGYDTSLGSPSATEDYRGIFVHHWSNDEIYLDIGGCCGDSVRLNTNGQTDGIRSDWHLYAYRYRPASASKTDPDNLHERSIWVDGNKVVASNTTPYGFTLNADPCHIIGSRQYDDPGGTWDAKVSCFLVYGRPLGDDEMMHNWLALKGRLGK